MCTSSICSVASHESSPITAAETGSGKEGTGSARQALQSEHTQHPASIILRTSSFTRRHVQLELRVVSSPHRVVGPQTRRHILSHWPAASRWLPAFAITAMFSRRLLSHLSNITPSASAANASAIASSTRPLTTTACRNASGSSQRAPALSDVAPDQGHIFDKKQTEFRAHLAEQVRIKKEQERASASNASSPSQAADKSASLSSSSSDSSTSSAISHLVHQGLGSLSTATGEAVRKQDGDKARSGGRLSSLIYGTEEGRQMVSIAG